MARNRLIKTEFFSDEKIGRLSFVARHIFLSLLVQADDSGVARANPAYVRATACPYDDISIQEIEKELGIIESMGLVERKIYNDEAYLVIKNFLKHQTINNPSAKRFIPKNETQDDTHSDGVGSNSEKEPEKNDNKDAVTQDEIKESVDKYVKMKKEKGQVKNEAMYKKKVLDEIEKDITCFYTVKEYIDNTPKKLVTNGLLEINSSIISQEKILDSHILDCLEKSESDIKEKIKREAENEVKKEFPNLKSHPGAMNVAMKKMYIKFVKKEFKDSLIKSNFCDSEFLSGKFDDIDKRSFIIDFSKEFNKDFLSSKKEIDEAQMHPFKNYFLLYYGKKESGKMIRSYYDAFKKKKPRCLDHSRN